MNFGGSFFGSFPTAGALSRTVLQDATGGHTQLVGFLSSGIVLIVILFLGFLFRSLPNVRNISHAHTYVYQLNRKCVKYTTMFKYIYRISLQTKMAKNTLEIFK